MAVYVEVPAADDSKSVESKEIDSEADESEQNHQARLLRQQRLKQKRDIDSQKSWIFKRDAHEHYFGSLVM